MHRQFGEGQRFLQLNEYFIARVLLCRLADQEAPRDGRFIEIIGTYNPKGQTAADKVKVDADKARQWIAKGATPSDTVQSLLKQAGVFQTAGTAKA